MSNNMKKIWYAPYKFEAYGQEEIDEVVSCLNDGWLGGFGERTVEFENQVAKIFGKRYGIFVNSGSSACLLAIAALNLPPDSEIVTPACTFSTTVAPIIQLGFVPVFCDVELTTYVPSVSAIVEKITDNTRAVMIPNLIGNKIDWNNLRATLKSLGREDIILIEDSCDTITHTPESDVSTTSFYASHVITSGGVGGMVMFNNEEYKKVALQYRDWGRFGNNSEDISERFNYNIDGIPYDFKFLYSVFGYNLKCSEMNAAFGLVQLKKLDGFLKTRRKNIERYLENLSDIEEIVLPDDSSIPNWLALPLQINKRQEMLTFLEENNIQTRVTFSGNITRHPAYRKYLCEFKNSDTIMRNGFLLGAHHGMDLDDVDYVCDKIKEFLA